MGFPQFISLYTILREHRKKVTKSKRFYLSPDSWFTSPFIYISCNASHESTPTGQVLHYFNINTVTTESNMVTSPVVPEDLKMFTPG